jgi:hypothetical protein
MAIPEPTVTVTEYDVSCLPIDHPERYTFTINVSWRGPGDVWAVKRGPWCISADGELDHEPSPSNRNDDFLATHRFPLDQALALAKEQAPLITVNRWTVEAVLAQEWER